MDKLYQEYGQLMIQFEILNGKISEVKRKIQSALSNKDKQQEKK